MSPTTTYKYVKPYTPVAPTVNNPQNTSLDIIINKNASEVSALEYAIYESTTGDYIQADGTLGASPAWQTISVWGTKTVTGLSSPVAQYNFQTKSRNISDLLDNLSSESSLSVGAGISNTAPSISIVSSAQQTGGANYVLINYTGTDTQNDTNNLTSFEFSTNTTDWFTMTEESGVGSNGTSTLLFTSGGASLVFAWDVGTDLPGVEDSTVYTRLQSTDTLLASNLSQSSAFAIDNLGPVVSDFNISQTPSTNNIVIEYDLSDNTGSGNIIELQISEDSGSTWDIVTTTATGDVGSGVTAGVDRNITWDAGIDFDDEEQSGMRVQLRATDSYGNISNFVSSSDFTIDTANPVVSNVSAAQSIGSSDVVITYDLSDSSASGHLVEFEVSQDSGVNWVVTSTSVTGDMGSGQTTGSKTFTWDAGTDFPGEDQIDMRARVRSLDYYGNQGLYVESVDFSIDAADPVVSGVFALQTVGTNNVVVSYSLSDTSASDLIVEIDISNDGGLNWDVTATSATGDIGAGQTTGSKTFTWDAGINFGNQYEDEMRVRVRATDVHGNIGDYFSSANFIVDTSDPIVSSVAALQNSGTNNVIITYNLSDETSGNINIELEISEDTGSTWVVTTTSLTGDIGAGVTAGVGKSVVWDAGTDFDNQDQSDLRARVVATDNYSNQGNYSGSVNFSIDTVDPIVSNVSASQTADSTNVAITYNLSETNNSTIEFDISDDSGSTWSVTTSSLSGDIGSGITAGSKTITWDAGTDFNNQDQSDLRARVRATDTYSNISPYVSSTDFVLDTLDPAINVSVGLQSQPNAGDTTVLISGSFTESNPNTNDFYVAINGGSYVASTVGDTNTASPSDQATAIYSTLDGNDYLSAVKITHTDDYGQSVDNEDLTPVIAYKYVKPYTPSAPTVDNTTTSTLDVSINANTSEVSGLEYAIYESTTGSYVQADGTLSASAVWQVRGVGAGEWGETSVVTGKITVIGLSSPIAQYSFQTKSRNTSDPLDAVSSESPLSTSSSVGNTSPAITINSASQTTDGTKYVTINYTGTDAQDDAASLVAYEYSQDNATWYTMTEKSGVGSSGTSSLAFVSGGASFSFAWDTNTDLTDTEDTTVYVRLKANDGIADGNIAVSSAFEIDTLNPIISNLDSSQFVGSTDVIIVYDLLDANNSTVEMDVSEDSGGAWLVNTTTLSGDIGSGITAGSSKSIVWGADTDFDNQYQTDMRVRVRALDDFGNQSIYEESSDFIIDTANPVITNVSAVQNAGLETVTVIYDIAEISSSTVEIDISSDGGITWIVTNASVTGDVGSGVASGTVKAIIWDAEVDFNNQEQSDMRVRLRGIDVYNNYGDYVESVDFELDTAEEEPEPEPIVIAGGSSVMFTQRITAPSKPFLTSFDSPTRENTFTISGIAEPRTRIDLYDKGELVQRLDSTSDSNGLFEQEFIFEEGTHVLSVKAVDFSDNASVLSNLVTLVIDNISPELPIILNPTEQELITDETPELIGVAEPLSTVIIMIDGDESFETTAGLDGAWNFVLPSEASLEEGGHNFEVGVIDEAGNVGPTIDLNIIKSGVAIQPEIIEGIVPGAIVPSIPLPSEVEIVEVVEAIELPGVPIPEVVETDIQIQDNIISFTGTALPNKDVVIYVHSDEALVYRTRSDDQGVWFINHSQDIVELSPGEHSIFAVTVDLDAKVKSRPSELKLFDIEKSFWITLYNLLNLQTTILALIIIASTTCWLYRIRRSRAQEIV